LAVSAATAGLGMGLHGLGAALPLHLGAVFVWTIAEILQSPFYASTVATLSTPSTRGRYQGVLGMAFGLGAMAGPPTGALAAGARLLERALPAASSCPDLAESVALVLERYLSDLGWQAGTVAVAAPRPDDAATTAVVPTPRPRRAPIAIEASARAALALGHTQ